MFAKKTFDRALKRLTEQGELEKIKDLNKAKNSKTSYKIKIDPKMHEEYRNIITKLTMFKEFLRNKKFSNNKILVASVYIIQLYSILYQNAIRYHVKEKVGGVTYQTMADLIKEQIDDFRILFFKRFKTQRSLDRFNEEARIMGLVEFSLLLTRFNRAMLTTDKPRTSDEVLLDHTQLMAPEDVRSLLGSDIDEEDFKKESRKSLMEEWFKKCVDLNQVTTVLKLELQRDFEDVTPSDFLEYKSKFMKTDKILDEFLERFGKSLGSTKSFESIQKNN